MTTAMGGNRETQCGARHITSRLSADRRAPSGADAIPASHLEMAMRTGCEPAVDPGLRSLLVAMPDDELLIRFRQFAPDSEQRSVACEILVERYEKLVRSCVRQYRGSPEPIEDLM